MERKLLKTGLYSFAIAVLAGIAINPYQVTVSTSYGIEQSTVIPIQVYVLRILRFAASVSVLSLFLVWVSSFIKINNEKSNWLQFAKGVLVSFVIVLILIVIGVTGIQFIK